MNFDLAALAATGSGYLLLLFGIAWATDRHWIPERIVLHPLVYTLSLGVFASVWACYTSVGIAMRHGYGYLAGYIGISLAFMFSPLLLRPIRQLTRTYQQGNATGQIRPALILKARKKGAAHAPAAPFSILVILDLDVSFNGLLGILWKIPSIEFGGASMCHGKL